MKKLTYGLGVAIATVGVLCLAVVFRENPVSAQGPSSPSASPRIVCDSRIEISTMPFEITESGSYYLSRDFEASAGGIRVLVGNVVIDLNGFRLQGDGSATVGIELSPGIDSVTVKNGILQQWSRGIKADETTGGRFSDLSIIECTRGIEGGEGLQISGCSIRFIRNVGIFVETASISDCTLHCDGSAGDQSGIRLVGGSVDRCSIFASSQVGILSRDADVRFNTVLARQGTGITAKNAVIHGNSVRNTTSIGIDVEEAVVSGNCVVVASGEPFGAGIDTTESNIYGNTIIHLAGSNEIVTDGASTVTNNHLR